MPSLEQPLFTAVLKRAEKGSYEFGAVDESKFRGPLHYVPINPDNGWWQFDSPGVVIGDRHVSTNDITSIAGMSTLPFLSLLSIPLQVFPPAMSWNQIMIDNQYGRD